MFYSNYDRKNSYNESFMNLENSLNEEIPFLNNGFDDTNDAFILGNQEPFLDKKEYNSDFLGINLKETDDDNNSSSDNIYFLKNKILNNINSPNYEKEDIIVKKEENLKKTGNNKSTEEKTLTNGLIIRDNSKNEKKYNTTNMGRKRKGYIPDKKKVHSKESEDNIRIKFKRLFINNLILFINNLLKQSPNIKLNGLEIKKLESSYANTTKKDKNLKMLNLTVGEFLSNPICKKFKKIPKNNNINVIKLIYEEDEKRIVKILNRTVRELMKIFCRNKVRNNVFKRFKRLKDYVEEFTNKKKEKESYIKKFVYQGKNFEEIYKEIDGRKEGIELEELNEEE